MMETRVGLIEAGGTKFVLGIADADGVLCATSRVETTNPAETISKSLDWFRQQGSISAIGIASFGPLQLDQSKPDWGCITNTPKPGWSGADLVRPFVRALDCPVALDTDVNGAALAEYRWGAGQGQNSVLYVTVGTGIGGGAVIDGKPVHGFSHPEMGHIRVARHPEDHQFAGCCPFHGDCLEGLASGPAILARWGKSLSELPAGSAAHGIIAFYLAQLVVNAQAMFSPGRIVMGGGVMQTTSLIDQVREQARTLSNGYFVGDPADVIVAPGLGTEAGLMGALAISLTS
jgi:fructokinase